MERKDYIEIDLKKIAFMLKKRILPIVLCALLGGALAAGVTTFFITPQYASEVKMYVFANTNRADAGSTITAGEIAASESLIGTYIVVLESDTVLSEVADRLQLAMTPNEIRRCLQIGAINDSAAFRVRVTTDNAERSAAIANTIADIAPQRIIEVVNAGGVQIIDRAKAATAPASPNKLQNTLLGALAGFLLSFGGYVLKEIFDTTIRTREDLTQEFGLPMLGTIPALTPAAAPRRSAPTGGI